MKKENRELAKKKREEERRRAQLHMSWKKTAAISIPVLILLALAGFLIVSAVQDRKEDRKQEGGESAVFDSEETEREPGLNTDAELVVQNGDTVNIDYVGTVDGVEFSGGSTNGMGANLAIGSRSFIDDFEEQLIGHRVGETVEVKVTFPENYGSNELNGKDAVFTVTINGIYQL